MKTILFSICPLPHFQSQKRLYVPELTIQCIWYMYLRVFFYWKVAQINTENEISLNIEILKPRRNWDEIIVPISHICCFYMYILLVHNTSLSIITYIATLHNTYSVVNAIVATPHNTYSVVNTIFCYSCR